jgi:hypothetical protein
VLLESVKHKKASTETGMYSSQISHTRFLRRRRRRRHFRIQQHADTKRRNERAGNLLIEEEQEMQNAELELRMQAKEMQKCDAGGKGNTLEWKDKSRDLRRPGETPPSVSVSVSRSPKSAFRFRRNCCLERDLRRRGHALL